MVFSPLRIAFFRFVNCSLFSLARLLSCRIRPTSALLWLVFSAGSSAADTAVTNVHILNGRGDSPEYGHVVIANGRVKEIRPATVRPLGEELNVIEGDGKYLLPGFIDMHAHLLVPRCRRGSAGAYFDEAVSKKMLSVLVDFGITSVRSPATPTVSGLQLRDDLNAGRLRGPRAYASAELMNFRSFNPQRIRSFVAGAMPYRPDYFKVYAGASPAAVAAIVAAAHAQGVPVIGHLGRTSWLEAAKLGIDHLTHAVDWSIKSLPPARRAAYREARKNRAYGPFYPRIVWLEQFDVGAAETRETIAAIAARGISVDPTLIAYDTKFAGSNGGRYAHDPDRGVVPELLDDWQRCPDITKTKRWTQEHYRRWNAAYPKLQAFVRALHEKGVLLTTGTDLTNPWVIPGRSLHQEFELLVEAGLSPKDVLVMTGANAATALGADDIGEIDVGKRADMVLLAENPLDDIRNTQKIIWVMQSGKIVSRGGR